MEEKNVLFASSYFLTFFHADVVASVIIKVVLSNKKTKNDKYIYLYKQFITLFYTKLFGADCSLNVLNAGNLVVRMSQYIGRART